MRTQGNFSYHPLPLRGDPSGPAVAGARGAGGRAQHFLRTHPRIPMLSGDSCVVPNLSPPVQSWQIPSKSCRPRLRPDGDIWPARVLWVEINPPSPHVLSPPRRTGSRASASGGAGYRSICRAYRRGWFRGLPASGAGAGSQPLTDREPAFPTGPAPDR